MRYQHNNLHRPANIWQESLDLIPYHVMAEKAIYHAIPYLSEQ